VIKNKKFMKKTMKSLVLLIAAVLLCEQTQAAEDTKAAETKSKATSRAAELFGDSVVAKGKGVEIKRSQLDDEFIRVKAQATANGRQLTSDQSTLLERQILDGLIQLRLLLAKATEADRAKGREQFATSLEQTRTNRNLTVEEFNQWLGPQLRLLGVTREQWEKQNADQAAARIVLEREMNVKVTEDDAKKFYEDNPSKFEEPEMVRVSHILISTQDPVTGSDIPDDKKTAKRKLAEDILKRAKAGEDWGKLVKEYSEDPRTKDKGGEYTFARASATVDPTRMMVKEFEDASFALNTNQISDIVTTSYGYHIIKLLEKLPARKEAYSGIETKSIYQKPDRQKFTIHDILAEQGMAKQFPDFMKKLKEEAKVEILDEKLKAVDLSALEGGAIGSPGAGSPAAQPSPK
jgi:parvulin-like peptidyl-prolyl isomerase